MDDFAALASPVPSASVRLLAQSEAAYLVLLVVPYASQVQLLPIAHHEQPAPPVELLCAQCRPSDAGWRWHRLSRTLRIQEGVLCGRDSSSYGLGSSCRFSGEGIGTASLSGRPDYDT